MSTITLKDILNAKKELDKYDIPRPHYVLVYGMCVPTSEDWLIWLFANEFNYLAGNI